jgi:hypothetical protein
MEFHGTEKNRRIKMADLFKMVEEGQSFKLKIYFDILRDILRKKFKSCKKNQNGGFFQSVRYFDFFFCFFALHNLSIKTEQRWKKIQNGGFLKCLVSKNNIIIPDNFCNFF